VVLQRKSPKVGNSPRACAGPPEGLSPSVLEGERTSTVLARTTICHMGRALTPKCNRTTLVFTLLHLHEASGCSGRFQCMSPTQLMLRSRTTQLLRNQTWQGMQRHFKKISGRCSGPRRGVQQRAHAWVRLNSGRRKLFQNLLTETTLFSWTYQQVDECCGEKPLERAVILN